MVRGPNGEPCAMTIPETKLVERAFNQRWEIPEEKRNKIVRELVDAYEDANTPPKLKLAIFRALVAADALNMEQERRDLNLPDHLNITVNTHEVVNEIILNHGEIIEAARHAATSQHVNPGAVFENGAAGKLEDQNNHSGDG